MRILVKEWQFSDGSHSLNNLRTSSQQSVNGSSNFLSRTGRKLKVTIVEGKDFAAKDKSGKLDPYVKLQYGKVGDTLYSTTVIAYLPLTDDMRPL